MEKKWKEIHRKKSQEKNPQKKTRRKILQLKIIRKKACKKIPWRKKIAKNPKNFDTPDLKDTKKCCHFLQKFQTRLTLRDALRCFFFFLHLFVIPEVKLLD